MNLSKGGEWCVGILKYPEQKNPKIKLLLPTLNRDDFNEKESDSDVEHYGVPGMKWGIRKDPQKAYDRANKKLSSLDKKAIRAGAKAAKREAISVQKQNKADTALLFKKRAAKKADKAIGKSERTRQRYVRSMSKAASWYKEMENAFKGTQVKTLNKEYIDLGKKYAEVSISELMANAETSYANKKLRMIYRQMSR